MKKESRQNLPLHDFGCEQVHWGDTKRYSMAFMLSLISIITLSTKKLPRKFQLSEQLNFS